jgi:hypothetical protein
VSPRCVAFSSILSAKRENADYDFDFDIGIDIDIDIDIEVSYLDSSRLDSTRLELTTRINQNKRQHMSFIQHPLFSLFVGKLKKEAKQYTSNSPASTRLDSSHLELRPYQSKAPCPCHSFPIV